jgi:hypothetical protein
VSAIDSLTLSAAVLWIFAWEARFRRGRQIAWGLLFVSSLLDIVATVVGLLAA